MVGGHSLGVTLPTMLPCLGWTFLIWEWPGPTLCGETGFSGHSGQFVFLIRATTAGWEVPSEGSRESMLTLVEDMEAIYQGHLGRFQCGSAFFLCVCPAPTPAGYHSKGRGNGDPPSTLAVKSKPISGALAGDFL